MFVIIILVVFFLLMLNELWLRNSHKINEVNRKFIHITVGSFVAFWPFLISWQQIRYLSLAFIFVVIVSKYLNLFKGIHSVSRPTFGEIFFALAVGGLTFLTQNRWVYLVAILQMSLADGMAAIFGTFYGKKNSYRVFGQHKSLIGSLSFFITSSLLLVIYSFNSGNVIPIYLLINLSIFLTLLENIAVFGIDNLAIPVVTVIFLKAIF